MSISLPLGRFTQSPTSNISSRDLPVGLSQDFLLQNVVILQSGKGFLGERQSVNLLLIAIQDGKGRGWGHCTRRGAGLRSGLQCGQEVLGLLEEPQREQLPEPESVSTLLPRGCVQAFISTNGLSLCTFMSPQLSFLKYSGFTFLCPNSLSFWIFLLLSSFLLTSPSHPTADSLVSFPLASFQCLPFS